MEFVELKKNLKAAAPAACYVCMGDDGFLIDRAVSIICSKVGTLKELNVVRKEFSSGKDVVTELMQLPVMSDFRVVIADGKFDMPPIEEYLKNPNNQSVLVLKRFIEYSPWKKQAKPTIPQGAITIFCNRLPAKYIYSFVRGETDKTNAVISDKEINLLINRCGGYMERISRESQKLAAMYASSEISEDDVIKNVEADIEYLVFDLSESILNRNSKKALEIVEGMAKDNDLVAAFTMLYNKFKRMFAAGVDGDSLTEIGVKPSMAAKMRSEAARYPKARLKNLMDMIVKADYSYKTGLMNQRDAITAFVVQAINGGEN